MESFDVIYVDGSIDKVKRVKRKSYKDLMILLRDLTEAFYRNNGSIGATISNDTVWSIIEKISAMLPVVGTDILGIKLDKLEDDLTQLAKIFFTQSIDENGIVKRIDDEWYKPSLLSEIHQFDYYGNAQEILKKMAKEEQAADNQ